MKCRRFFDFLTLCLLSTLVVFSNLARADEPPLRVAITPDSLRFAWSPSAGTTEIRELPLHTSAAGEGHVLWSGEGAEATVPRFDGKRDRLFAKFELRVGGKVLGSPQHVTDFSALPQRKNSLGSLANKKGIACLGLRASKQASKQARDGLAARRGGWQGARLRAVEPEHQHRLADRLAERGAQAQLRV